MGAPRKQHITDNICRLYSDGMSVAEIAKLRGMTRQGVHYHLHLAKKEALQKAKESFDTSAGQA